MVGGSFGGEMFAEWLPAWMSQVGADASVGAAKARDSHRNRNANNQMRKANTRLIQSGAGIRWM